jgi:DNA sulfur modification protein DndE
MINTVTLNQNSKDRMSTIKRYTGIENWNTICRWAFCISMADKTTLPEIDRKGDIGVEMSWKIFAGDLGDVFLAMLQKRCIDDNIEISSKNLNQQLWLHLNRGVGHIFANKQFKEDFSKYGKTPISFLKMTME